MSDAVQSGYSPQRVAEIVADLRERLRAANDSSVVQDLGFAPEPRARRTSRRLTSAVWLLVCSLFVVFGIATGLEGAAVDDRRRREDARVAPPRVEAEAPAHAQRTRVAGVDLRVERGACAGEIAVPERPITCAASASASGRERRSRHDGEDPCAIRGNGSLLP
jgi:hypothetical protein